MANAAITVDLNAKIAQFETELKKATGSLDRFEKKSQQASAAIKNAFGTLGLTIGAGVMVRGIARMADEFSSLQARLKLASRDTAEFNAANADLIRISQAAQAPLSETATLYTRIAASVKDLDVSQRAIADTTEAVALALKISGASGAEASSAMLQFSQAMASGVLRGEEFNSINEAAPRLLQALASSLKVPVGSLREMAKEGQLTRDVLINGLLSELPKLQAEAQTIPKTIGSAFTALNNTLLLTVGKFDELSGASSTFAAGLGGVSQGLSNVLKRLEDINRLKDAGAGFFDFFNGNVSANIDKSLKNVGGDIRDITADIERLRKNSGGLDSSIAPLQAQLDRLKKIREELIAIKVEQLQTPPKKAVAGNTDAGGVDPNQEMNACIASGGIWDGKTCKKKLKTGKSDPLASLLGSTDIGKLEAFDKQVALLNARFDGGRKSTELYTQAMTKLVESTFSDSFKKAADDAEFFRAVEEDGIRTTQEWRQNLIDLANVDMSRLEDLISNSDFSKLAKDQEDMVLLAKAFSEGITDADGNMRKLSEAEYLDIVKNKLGLVGEAVKETKSLADEIGLSFTSAFEDAIAGGKSFSEVLESLGQDLIKLMTRKAITEPLLKAIGGVDFGAMFSGATANANGGVYSSPSLSAYSGSIVSSPTMFKFASGAGLMGEAGPEAILPLKRGANGKLGIEGGGGGVTVVINNNANNTKVTQAESLDSRGNRRLSVTVSEMVAGEVRRSGSAMNNSIRQSFGSQPSLVTR